MPQLELGQLPQFCPYFLLLQSKFGRVKLRESLLQRDKGSGTGRFLKPCSNPKTEEMRVEALTEASIQEVNTPNEGIHYNLI